MDLTEDSGRETEQPTTSAVSSRHLTLSTDTYAPSTRLICTALMAREEAGLRGAPAGWAPTEFASRAEPDPLQTYLLRIVSPAVLTHEQRLT